MAGHQPRKNTPVGSARCIDPPNNTCSIADELSAALANSQDPVNYDVADAELSRKTPDRFLQERRGTSSRHHHRRGSTGGGGGGAVDNYCSATVYTNDGKVQRMNAAAPSLSNALLSDFNNSSLMQSYESGDAFPNGVGHREKRRRKSAPVQGGINNSGDDTDVADTTPLLRNKRNGASSEAPSPKVHQKRSLVFITLATLLITMAAKCADPVFEQYVYQVYTKQVYGNTSVKITQTPCVNTSGSNSSSDKLRELVQTKSANLLMWLEVLSLVIGTISCLFLGTYSDVIGRRLVILVPTIGHFIRDALSPVIIYWDLGLPVLFAGYAFYGLCGGVSGTVLGFFVYTADVTTTEKGRTVGLALIFAAMGIGVAGTQYASGVFIQETGFFYPALTASLCDLACIFTTIVFLPETRHRDRTRSVMTPLGSLKRIATTFLSHDHPQQRPLLLIPLVALFFGVAFEYAIPRLDILFLMNKPFCWSSSKIGLLAAVKLGVTKVTAILLLIPLQRVMSTKNLAILGALSFAASNIVMGLATTDLMVYLSAAANMASTILFSATRAIMSRMVSADRQGALFGGISVVESLCFGVGQLSTFSLYKAVVSTIPGITYFFVGFWFVVDIVLYMVYGCLKNKADNVVRRGGIEVRVEKPCST